LASLLSGGENRNNKPSLGWTTTPIMTRIATMANDRPTLLVVEDNDDDIFFIERIFRQLEARCDLKFVHDGLEALEYLAGKGNYADRSKFPLPTIILMDLKMPRMNGFEVLEWMQKQPEIKLIPTIVVTSSTLQEDVTRAYRLGANAVMNKPVDKDSLLQMLKTFHIYWTDYVEMPEVKPVA
jgi:CheY-like chemotaxis protein